MTVAVSRSRVVRRDADDVAALVTDPSRLLPFLADFGRFDPLGEDEYDVFLDIGTIHVGGRVQISRPDARTLFWHSIRGTTHTLELRVDDHEQGSLVTMTLTLTLFGLAVARIAELMARGIMDRHVIAGLEQLRHALEYDEFG
ncbi:hypothetical protein BJ980_003334 [Nocardioides daedukensis]|uniref:SRPBCC family protein n=1 Tax=Nocardioides daedukensis TaxID=634462 RepID=A0A7Y9S163_9ACTN|nr:hypothetical protein [Nocardioides daedukensis]NYG60411.1 hypothetical protein [Nocardioides daedukensis]